jgi:hypothetical protein
MCSRQGRTNRAMTKKIEMEAKALPHLLIKKKLFSF